MERIRPSTKAWAAFLGGAALYEFACPPGETLSEGLDPLCEHPIKRRLLEASLVYTALHLTNHLPEKFDLFHQLSKIKKDKQYE